MHWGGGIQQSANLIRVLFNDCNKDFYLEWERTHLCVGRGEYAMKISMVHFCDCVSAWRVNDICTLLFCFMNKFVISPSRSQLW